MEENKMHKAAADRETGGKHQRSARNPYGNSRSPKNNEPRTSKLVSMRFRPETIDDVSYLRDATGNDNRTQITAEAIALARWWVESKKKGGKLYVEFPDGERESVVMPGL